MVRVPDIGGNKTGAPELDTDLALGLDLRQSIGFGLRYASPIGLLRLDVGFPLSRREGEKAGDVTHRPLRRRRRASPRGRRPPA